MMIYADVAGKLLTEMALDNGLPYDYYHQWWPRLVMALVLDAMAYEETPQTDEYTSDLLCEKIWTLENIEEMAAGERGDGETKADKLEVDWPTTQAVLAAAFDGEEP